MNHFCGSLSESVDKSIAKRLPDAIHKEFAKFSDKPAEDPGNAPESSDQDLESSVAFDRRLRSQVMAVFEGPVSQLHQKLAETVQTALDSMDTKLKTSMRYSMQELDKINETISTDPDFAVMQKQLSDLGERLPTPSSVHAPSGMSTVTKPHGTDTLGIGSRSEPQLVALEVGMTANVTGLVSTPSLAYWVPLA